MSRIILHLWLAVFFLMCSWAAYGAAAPARTATAATSPGVAAAMKAVEQAKSLPELAQAFKKLSLSANEQQQFAAQMRISPLRKKMESMRNQAFAASVDTPPRMSIAHGLLVQKRSALAKARGDRLAGARASLLATKPTTRRPTAGVQTTKFSPITVQMKAQIAAGLPAGSDASISEVTQPIVGQSCTIRGSHLGSSRGRVVFLIHRGLFYCSVQDWANSSITFTVPADLEEFVGYRPDGHEAVLWVKLAGGEMGPLQDVVIKPDPAAYTPTITSVTPPEITPGQTFMVRGRNFVKYDPSNRPSVRVRFPNGTLVRALVEDATNEWVQAVLPDDIGGMQATLCTLKLTNDVDVQAETGVRFIPAEEILAIESAESLTASCEPTDFLVFCLFGEKVQYTVHDFRLKNGWVVEDVTIDTSEGGPNAGAYFISKPEKGSTNGRTVVEVWADAYSYCNATVTLFIKGPQGVPYQ